MHEAYIWYHHRELNQKWGKVYPLGHFISDKVWIPSEKEKCSCCHMIMTPTKNDPWTLLNHCRRMKHVRHMAEEHPDTFMTFIPAPMIQMVDDFDSVPLFINSPATNIREFAEYLLKRGH